MGAEIVVALQQGVSKDGELQQAAEALAGHGYPLDTVTAMLAGQFPEIKRYECRAVAFVALQGAKAGQAVAEPSAPEPVPAPQYGAPLGPASAEPKRTRDRFRWIPAPSIAIGQDRAVRTLIAADIASMPFIFNGKPGTYETSWGTMTVDGQLCPFDLRAYVALSQEIQETGPQCTSCSDNGRHTECYTAETSFHKLYRHINDGKYGGSGCRRIQRSLDRLQAAVVTVRDRDHSNEYRFRVVESYEAVSAPSGKRLIVRLGHGLTTRIFAKGGMQGMKPIDLEPWHGLGGRTALAYLWVDNLCVLHGGGSLKIDTLVQRLNIKGSTAKQRHQVVQMVAKLNGRACSSERETRLSRVLTVAVVDHKIVFRAEVPAANKQAA